MSNSSHVIWALCCSQPPFFTQLYVASNLSGRCLPAERNHFLMAPVFLRTCTMHTLSICKSPHTHTHVPSYPYICASTGTEQIHYLTTYFQVRHQCVGHGCIMHTACIWWNHNSSIPHSAQSSFISFCTVAVASLMHTIFPFISHPAVEEKHPSAPTLDMRFSKMASLYIILWELARSTNNTLCVIHISLM